MADDPVPMSAILPGDKPPGPSPEEEVRQRIEEARGKGMEERVALLEALAIRLVQDVDTIDTRLADVEERGHSHD